MADGDRRRWLRVGALLVVGCFVAGAVAAILLLDRRDGAPAVAQAPFDGVFIEPGLSLTVKPFPSGTGDLTAGAAWAVWESGGTVPSDATARFGLLDDQGRYHLVWAYSEPGCHRLPGFRRHLSPVNPPRCRAWVFLAPRTGRMILGIAGKIG